MADLGNTVISGRLTVINDSNILGNAIIKGALTVTGTSTLNNNVTIASGKTLTVGGTSTFNDNVTITSAKTLTVGGTTTIKSKLIVNPSYDTASNSFNEGIRINKASNNWAEVCLGGAVDSTAGTGDKVWVLGVRGEAGSKSGAVGDFTIEHNGSTGTGLTLYKNGNAPTWNNNTLLHVNGGSGLEEGSSDVTDNTELITSYASNNGFADTNAPGKLYRRDAVKFYNYIKGKTDSLYAKAPVSKTYNGLIGTTDSVKNATFYFINVLPSSWQAEWTVKFRLECDFDGTGTPDNYQYMHSTHECFISGSRGKYTAYAYFNNINNTTYRVVGYGMLAKVTEAGFNAGEGHKLGITLNYNGLAYQATNANYKRKVKVTLIEAVNCTASLLDAPLISHNSDRSDYTKLNSTYFPSSSSDSNNPGYTSMLDLYNQGLRETGDDNTFNRLYYHDQWTTIGDLALSGYSVFGYDNTGKIQAISVNSSSNQTTNGSTGLDLNRTYNSGGFDWTRGLFRWCTNSFDIAGSTNLIHADKVNQFDYRYTDNCVNSSSATTLSFVSNKYVYLRGTLGSDGLFYLAPIEVTYNNSTYKRAWTQDIPTTEDGYVYWLVGHPYSTDSYQLRLYAENPLYWFKHGQFIEYGSTPKMVETTWAELKGWRDRGELIPGQSYRITDYACTTTQPNTRTAGHEFDLIVTANANNKLNAEASAVQHSGDTYFNDCQLWRWKIWYSLDNNTDEFAWASPWSIYTDDDAWFTEAGTTFINGVLYYLWYNDNFYNNENAYLGSTTIDPSDSQLDKISIDKTTIMSERYSEIAVDGDTGDDVIFEGRGVIYRMIDEFNNDVAYDFKNIQFKRFKITSEDPNVYATKTVGNNTYYKTDSGRLFHNRYVGYISINYNNCSIASFSISNINDYIWAYTFSGLCIDYNNDRDAAWDNISNSTQFIDLSIVNFFNMFDCNESYHNYMCRDNIIKSFCHLPDRDARQRLNNIVLFGWTYDFDTLPNGYKTDENLIYINGVPMNNKFDIDCIDMTFAGESGHMPAAYNIIVGAQCCNILMGPSTNTTIMSGCTNIIIAYSYESTVGTNCYRLCLHNGIEANLGSYVTDVYSLSRIQGDIGNDSGDIRIGFNTRIEHIGSYCNYINIGTSADALIEYVDHIIIEDRVSNINLYSADTTASSSNTLQNVILSSYLRGSSSINRLNVVVPDRNLSYITRYQPTNYTEVLL